MLKKVYYYKFSDLEETYLPFSKGNLANLIKYILDLEDLTGLQVPSDISTNAVYNELISLVLGKYHEHAIIKIIKFINEDNPTDEEIYVKLQEWCFKLIALLNDTYEYYTTLLNLYNSAKTDLMADIKATSKNKVKFNDTPQNTNTSGTYEGDNYITHFTATEGENSSPLMSKIMRLKEIQENYKNLMRQWVADFERIFYQEDC